MLFEDCELLIIVKISWKKTRRISTMPVVLMIVSVANWNKLGSQGLILFRCRI